MKQQTNIYEVTFDEIKYNDKKVTKHIIYYAADDFSKVYKRVKVDHEKDGYELAGIILKAPILLNI